MQTNPLTINHFHSASYDKVYTNSNPIHTYSQSPETQSTADTFILDQSSYQSLISSLDKLSPFEAIRYAQEINKLNVFEVVSRVEIGKWKRFLGNQNLNYEMDNAEQIDNMIRPTPHHNAEIEIENSQKEVSDIENVEIKRQQLQRGYMLLLNT